MMVDGDVIVDCRLLASTELHAGAQCECVPLYQAGGEGFLLLQLSPR